MFVDLETALILFATRHSVTFLAVLALGSGAAAGAVLGASIGAARANARQTRS